MPRVLSIPTSAGMAASMRLTLSAPVAEANVALGSSVPARPL
ncbi:hypothetical protein [Roseivivax halodurans]|nr:hypothetical protein [Roseivivax halodurans]